MYKHYFNKKKADVFFNRLSLFLIRATVVSVVIGTATLFIKLFGLAPSMTWLQAWAPLLLYYAVFTICVVGVSIYSVIEDKRKRKCTAHICADIPPDNKQT